MDLTNDEVNAFIEKAKGGDSSAIKTLALFYNKLIISSVNKYYHFEFDDAYADRFLLVFNAASKYDPKFETKFSTYLTNTIKQYCWNQNKYLMRNVNLKEKVMTNTIACRNENLEDEVKYFKHLIDQIKDDNARTIFYKRYFSGTRKPVSFHQISKELNLTFQRVTVIHNQYCQLLRNKIESDNTLDIL